MRRIERRTLAFALGIGLVAALALGARLYGIDEPPLDSHPTREYHSFTLARDF